jgi:PEGA domain
MKRALLFLLGFLVGGGVTDAAQVVITSDPPGATICAGDKQLGTTPLTTDLAPGPDVLTSRFGSLTPVTETVTSEEGQPTSFHFQHLYGTLIVNSDRTDATLKSDGADFGHPPAPLFVSPGTHKIFLTASNAPDKTRSVDVAQGQQASVKIDFAGASPETITVGPSPTANPSASPAPAKATPTPKPASIEVWQDPSAIPLTGAGSHGKPSTEPKRSAEANQPKPISSPATGPKRAIVALISVSPAPTPDPATDKALLESERKATETALNVEKQKN